MADTATFTISVTDTPDAPLPDPELVKLELEEPEPYKAPDSCAIRDAKEAPDPELLDWPDSRVSWAARMVAKEVKAKVFSPSVESDDPAVFEISGLETAGLAVPAATDALVGAAVGFTAVAKIAKALLIVPIVFFLSCVMSIIELYIQNIN